MLIIAGIIAFYLLLRFNSFWVYRFFDNAMVNGRSSLKKDYELPRYFKLDGKGAVDYSTRWPGWDGWYFFMLPKKRDHPLKMVRGSIMTGIYGLDGVDDYDLLSSQGVGKFNAAEFLNLTVRKRGGDGDADTCLFHKYLPRDTSLVMNRKKLDVAIEDLCGKGSQPKERYGAISGTWPEYSLEFKNPLSGTKVELVYKGEDIIWWADIPGIFTYFAAFGEFNVKITHSANAVDKRESAEKTTEEVTELTGKGFFEHGFARKPFNFDWLWLPVKLIKVVFKRFNPVRYHYELFVNEDGSHGGFMHARVFGINFRNRGGYYMKGKYSEIKRVGIKYYDVPPPDKVQKGTSKETTTFYRKWRVRAVTDDGILEYVGEKQGQHARIANNMTYYNFFFEGTHGGEAISGRGYGEYLNI